MTETPDANVTGKRYTCSVCQTQVLCSKGGTGRIVCHEVAMELQGAKALPASD